LGDVFDSPAYSLDRLRRLPNTHGDRTGGADSAAEDLVRVQRDKEIISQRLEDVPLRVIATDVGCALSTVQAAVKRWLAEHSPAADKLRSCATVKVAPRVMSPLRDPDGAITYDGNGAVGGR